MCSKASRRPFAATLDRLELEPNERYDQFYMTDVILTAVIRDLDLDQYTFHLILERKR